VHDAAVLGSELIIILNRIGRHARQLYRDLPIVLVFIHHRNRSGGQFILVPQFRNISADKKVLSLSGAKT